MRRTAAAHRRDDARVALHPARLRIRPRACWRPRARVIVDEIHAVAPQQARRASGAVARAARGAVRPAGCCASACRRRRSRSRRSRASWSAPAARVDGRRLHHRRHRPRARARPRARGSGLAARGGDVGARCGSEIYDRLAELIEAAPHDADLRQHAPHGRAGDARSSRSGSARTHVAAHHGSLAKEQRLDAEQRLKARRAARRWSPPPRSSSASTSARSISSARSARRARSPPSCSASGAPATRSAARRRAGCSRCRATSWSNAPRCSTASRRGELDALDDSRAAARRAGAADRRRGRGAGMERGRAVRAVAPRLALSRRCRARSSPRSCACWPKASPRGAAGAAR